MRSLQYKMMICQKSHYKVTKTVYVWFEFLWIRHYIKEVICLKADIVMSAFKKSIQISKDCFFIGLYSNLDYFLWADTMKKNTFKQGISLVHCIFGQAQSCHFKRFKRNYTFTYNISFANFINLKQMLLKIFIKHTRNSWTLNCLICLKQPKSKLHYEKKFTKLV